MQVYCRIIDYIHSKNTDLADIIRYTCADMTLNSTRGRNGVTFLMPSDDYIKEIQKLAFDSDLEVVEKADRMIHSLILSGVYLKPSDMQEDKYLANCVMPPQALEIKKVDGNKVYFTDSVYAEPDKDFKCLKKKFAVWKLHGKMPIMTRDAERRPLFTPARHQERSEHKKNERAKPKSGMYENADYNQERMKIIITIENLYLAREQQRRKITMSRHCDVYFCYSMSLLCFLHDKDVNTFNKAMWKISGDKTDMYYLLEPHSNKEHLVSDDLIMDWWKSNQDYECADINKAKKCISKWLKDNEKERLSKREAAASFRNNTDANMKGLLAQIESVYKNNPNKLMEDELRYLAAQLFCRFEADNHCDIGKFNFIANYIGDIMHKGTPTLTDINALRNTMLPIEKLTEIKRFVNSSWFMYVPIVRSEMSNDGYYRPKADRELKQFWKNIDEKMSEHVVSSINTAVNKDYILKNLSDEKFRSKVMRELTKLENSSKDLYANEVLL